MLLLLLLLIILLLPLATDLTPASSPAPDLTPASAQAPAPAPQEVYHTTEKKDKTEDITVTLTKLGNLINSNKEIVNKVDALHAGESTCHECTSKDELEIYKEDIVFEKEELYTQKGY